jgi:uncharacterized protein involved in tolerance to divalent cations
MSLDTPQACEIIVTGPTDDTLDKIARELVDARLIACANVLEVPVTSTYRWQGAVEVEPVIKAAVTGRAGRCSGHRRASDGRK